MTIHTGGFDNLAQTQTSNLNEQLLTAIARSAENLTTGQGWPDGVNALLANLGKITQVSRVWIFQTLELRKDYILQDYAFEWASAPKFIQIGLPTFNRFKSAIDTPEYASLIESRKAGEYQHLTVDLLSNSWLKSYLKEQKITSMLTIPIIVENKWWGTLGFDDCERHREWSASEIALLRTATYLIAGAVLRDSLSAKTRQLEILKKITACSAWELDIRRGHLWCTPEVISNVPAKANNLQLSFKQCLKRIHPDHRDTFLQTIKNFMKGQAHSFRADLKIKREDGHYCWVEVSAALDKDNTKGGDVLAGILLDITNRKEAEERLRHEATTDPLTGVFNRRKIEYLVQESMIKYSEAKEPFSLLLLDLDHFKHINDNYGHTVGDKILCHFTQLCQKALRKVDLLSRIGGEEFAILLPNTNEEAAHRIGNRICQSIRDNSYSLEGEPIPYSVSIGCTTLKEEYLELHNVFERADSALYLAKKSGRNQVKVG